MANANIPSGLSPVGYLNGSPWNGQVRRYYIPSSDTNAYAIGDPVTLAGSADAKGVPSVVLWTAGSGMIGPVMGMGGPSYGGMSGDPTNLNTTVIPATKTKDYYILVADDANIIFEVQEIGTGTALDAAAVGLNANLVAGTNNGYISGALLTNDSEATTVGLDVKLLGLSQSVTPNAFGAYAKWRVKINNHLYAVGHVGV